MRKSLQVKGGHNGKRSCIIVSIQMMPAERQSESDHAWHCC